MPRRNLRQQLPFTLTAIAALGISLAVATFAQLVAEYGFWTVVSQPIYPVAYNPTIMLSNGEVWSQGKSFLNFLGTVVLWLAMFIGLTFRKWPGINT